MDSKPQTPPWDWSEDVWRRIVGSIEAGPAIIPAQWPNGAKACVALTFDADHETLALAAGGRSLSRLSQGQYGARNGSPRIFDLLRRSDIPATFFMPAVSAMLHPREARRVVDEGHEIGIHSWIHESNLELRPEIERTLAFRARDTLERISGQRPVGMRTASWDFTAATLPIIREMELSYDSSLMADDDPYEIISHGERTGIIELPVEWIKDDAPYFQMDRLTSTRPHSSPGAVLDVFLREFNYAFQRGGFFMLTLHPHHIGHPSRLWILEEVIRAAKASGEVWFATLSEVADLCRKLGPMTQPGHAS